MHIYRDIFRRAWVMLWRYPWLWVFGLLVALIGNSNEYNTLFSAIDRISSEGAYLAYLKDQTAMNQIGASLHNVFLIFTQSPVLLTWMVMLSLLVVLIIVWVITVAKAGLIQASGDLEAGRKATFSGSTISAAQFFWPIFILNVLTKFFIYLVLLVALLPFFLAFLVGSTASLGFSMMVLVSFVILIPLTLIVSFILKYAAIYVVLERAKWWNALEQATMLFFRNWLVSLEMAAFLFLFNVLVSLILLFVLIPDVLTIKQELIRSAFAQYVSPIVTVRLLFAVLIFVAAGTWYAVFDTASWVLLFRRLHGENVVPKLVRAVQATPAMLKQWWT